MFSRFGLGLLAGSRILRRHERSLTEIKNTNLSRSSTEQELAHQQFDCIEESGTLTLQNNALLSTHFRLLTIGERPFAWIGPTSSGCGLVPHVDIGDEAGPCGLPS
jgi:hypothetical protein